MIDEYWTLDFSAIYDLRGSKADPSQRSNAIKSIGEILSQFTVNEEYRSYGFGATPKGSEVASDLFRPASAAANYDLSLDDMLKTLV